MAKITGTVVSKIKRSPVKAGSKPRPHGGFPTQAVITLRTMKVAKKHG
jgi:hypothetical protein